MISTILDPVKRWKSHIADSTWERCYKQHWDNFVELFKVEDPTELVSLTQQQASDLALQYREHLESKGYSSKFVCSGYCAIRSFFAYNGIRLEKMSQNFAGHVQYRSYVQIEQKDVFALVEAVPSYRDKFAASLCYQGGQRDGLVEALKLKHIVTKDWQNAKVSVFDIPELLLNYKGQNVNKRKVKYRFGLLDDAMRFLKLHLEERARAGEKLTPESWLVRSRSLGGRKRGTFADPESMPITADYVNTVVKKAAARIGIQSSVLTNLKRKQHQITAHNGRLYFKTQMRDARVDLELRNFMMGHKVAYGGAYDKYREREIIEAMEQARSVLALTPQSITEVELRKQTILDNAKLFMDSETFEQLKQFMVHARTTEEVERALENFNGRGRLRRMGEES